MARRKGQTVQTAAERFFSSMGKMMEREATRMSMIALDRECMETLLRENKKLFDIEKAKELDISEEQSPCDYRQVYASQMPLLKRKDSHRKRSLSQMPDPFAATKRLRFSTISPERGAGGFLRAATSNSTLLEAGGEVAHTVERIERM